MSGSAKQRVTLTDLREPQQMRELNRQLTWIWDQLLGGLSMKSLNAGARKIIDSKAEESVVDELGNVVSEHSTQIVQTAEKIEQTATAVDTLEGRVEKNESAISQTPTQIRMAVESLQIGGRNYIIGTAEPYTAVGTGSRQWLYPWHCASIAANRSLYGKTVTISFDYEEAITSGSFGVTVNGLWIGVKSFDSDTGSGHFTLTREHTDFEADDDVFIYIDGTWTGSVKFSNMKVEIGNKATDWSPAPEDTDAAIESLSAELTVQAGQISASAEKIETVNQAAANAQSTANAAQSTASGAVTRVTAAEQRISAVEGEITSKVSKEEFDELGRLVSAQETKIEQTDEQVLILAGRTVGGRNYVLGTAEPYTAIGTGSKLVLHAWKCASKTVLQGLFGKEVTVSFDYEENITSGSFNVLTGYTYQGIKTFDSNAGSGHLTKTFTLNNGTAGGDVILYIDGTWTGSVTFSNMKVEIGNTATDWTPAPKDAAKSVDAGGVVRVDQTGVHMSGGTIEMETSDGDEYIHIRNDGISASSLSAPDVTPRYSGPGTLYVNPNATSAQIAAGNYARSLADAFGKLNGHYISGEITVSCASGAALYGNAELADVSGGYVVISGNGATLYGALTLKRNACAVQINKLNASVSSGDAFTATHCGYVGMWSNTLNSSAGKAIVMTNGGQFYATGCTLIGGGGMAANITTATLAVFINCVGTGKIVVQYAALTAGGTVPLGGAENWGGSLFNASGVTPTGADGTPAAPVISTATYNYTSSDSYRGGWSYFSDEDIRQGYISSGTIYGVIWFDAAAIRTALSGKTINQVSLRLHMHKGVGRGVAVSVQLYGTSTAYDGRSGAPALTTSYGTIGTTEPDTISEITIPTQVITDIVNGTIQGLVLKSDDAELYKDRDYSRNYARFSGSTTATAENCPRLTVVYQ